MTNDDIAPLDGSCASPSDEGMARQNQSPDLESDEQIAERDRQRLRQLPPEVGIVLVSVGIVGAILPLVWGMPFLAAGGLILMPRTFERTERWARKRWPETHRAARRALDRFIDDYQSRFPIGARADQSETAASRTEARGDAPEAGDSACSTRSPV